MARRTARRRSPQASSTPSACSTKSSTRSWAATTSGSGRGRSREALAEIDGEIGRPKVERVLDRFATEFPDGPIPRGHGDAADEPLPQPGSPEARAEAIEELLLLALANSNPAAEPFRELFDDSPLAASTDYPVVLARLEAILDDGPPLVPGGLPLLQMLRSPALASPTSLAGQLRYIRERWASVLGDLGGLLDRLLVSLDVLAEEERGMHLRFGGGGGGFGGVVETPEFGGLDAEPERFSWDSDWMPRVVLMAKSTFVWLDQLSRRYGRDIRTLDAVPDEELDRLAAWGVTGLWLIGLWERSKASERIKRLRGNPDAVASAYSLHDYRIADDLGGEAAFDDLKIRSWARGIRMASDMVPNHMGIDSSWVVEHPDWFLLLGESPYPSYSFNGPDLSSDERVGIFLEDHYYDSSDAAVTFKRLDRWSGESRYLYHGNDGTSFPWNDTAQLDYLKAEVREAVIRTILDVARRSPIIRFDAAMVLAKKHVQRLWYPEPGAGGAIPSRAEHAIPKAVFDSLMPVEFWREVVDRVATEVPDTLLLAEAFWLMEGYFVRTLGMHRVYNSAFMHMLRDEDNAGYRRVMKETLEFDPEILKRYVNFMSNPDEKTAVEQFGKGDKYFGVASVLAHACRGSRCWATGRSRGSARSTGWSSAGRRSTSNRTTGSSSATSARPSRSSTVAAGSPAPRTSRCSTSSATTGPSTRTSTPTPTAAARPGRWSCTTTGLPRRRVGSGSPAAFARKAPDGSKRLERRSLVTALGLDRAADDDLIAFRDARSGLEYIRTVRELRDGLAFRLDAYQGHVFWEFREVRDRAGIWRRLTSHLGGRGVPSLEGALRELELEPVYAAVRAVTSAPGLGGLVRDGKAARDVEPPLRELVARVREATGTDGDAAAVVRTISERLETIGRRATSTAGHAKAAAGDPLHVVASAFGDPWHRAVLAGWAVLEPLGLLAKGAMAGPTSRAWFDELRLGPVVANGLREAGLDEGDAWRAVERIGTLLALPRPSNVGGRSAPERARRLVEAWLVHADVRPFIRVNAWEGTEWFGRDEWRELLDWALLLDGVDSDAGADDAAAKASAAAVRRLLELGETAGYRVDRLRELVGVGGAAVTAPAGKAPGKKAAAKKAAAPKARRSTPPPN